MIGILAKKFVSFQLSHIVIAFLTVDGCVHLVGIETRATSAKLALLGGSGIFIEGWHLGEGEYTGDVDKFVGLDVFILINNQFEVDVVVI